VLDIRSFPAAPAEAQLDSVVMSRGRIELGIVGAQPVTHVVECAKVISAGGIIWIVPLPHSET